MFMEEISLWAGGPSVTLGDYFIGFRYLFCLLLAGFALAVYRRPRPGLLFAGSLALAGLGWLAFELPLGRIYGLTGGGAALVELGPAMVVAATGAPSASSLVAETNPWPAWSLLLALLSGFDPERLLALYPWVSLGVLVVLAGATSRSARSLFGPAGDPSARLVPALAVFFVLFLSAPRLSFLEEGGPLWVQILWLRPRLGAGVAASLLGLGAVSSGKLRGALSGGLLLGVSGWLEPMLLALSSLALMLWMLLQVRRRAPVWSGAGIGLGVALVLFALWPSHPPLSASAPSWTWPAAVERLLDVSLRQGAVFYLGVLGWVGLYRGGRPSSGLLLSWVVAAYGLFIVVAIVPAVSELLDPLPVKSGLRVALAVAAAAGAYDALRWLDARWPSESTLPGGFARSSLFALGLAGLVALSVPWSFPFWWNPVRMDPIYRESFPPISRQRLAFAEWLRESTSPGAVFAAGPSYAPWIPPLSGRQVLLDGASWPLPSNEEREAVQDAIVFAGDADALREVASDWGVDYVAWGRLDPLPAPEAELFESSPALSLVYRQQRWVSVYEVTR